MQPRAKKTSALNMADLADGKLAKQKKPDGSKPKKAAEAFKDELEGRWFSAESRSKLG